MRKFKDPFTRWFGDGNKNVILVADLKEMDKVTSKLSPLLWVVTRS